MTAYADAFAIASEPVTDEERTIRPPRSRAVTSALRDHLPRGGLRPEVRALEIEVDDGVPRLLVGLEKR